MPAQTQLINKELPSTIPGDTELKKFYIEVAAERLKENMSDEKAMQFLINVLKPLIKANINRLMNKFHSVFTSGLDDEKNIEQEIYTIILKGVKDWDRNKNKLGFLGYISLKIPDALFDFVKKEEEKHGIVIPRIVREHRILVDKYMEKYKEQHKKEPKKEEIIDYMRRAWKPSKGHSPFGIDDLVNVFKDKGISFTYLDKPTDLARGGESRGVDTILKEFKSPESSYIQREIRQVSKKFFNEVRSKLSKDQQTILKMMLFDRLDPDAIAEERDNPKVFEKIKYWTEGKIENFIDTDLKKIIANNPTILNIVEDYKYAYAERKLRKYAKYHSQFNLLTPIIKQAMKAFTLNEEKIIKNVISKIS